MYVAAPVGPPSEQRSGGDGHDADPEEGEGEEGGAVGGERPVLVLGHHVVPLEGQHGQGPDIKDAWRIK